jgi:hypothetical protein
MPNELHTSRGRFVFWIGLAVLPIFWLWWMSERHFTRRQIWCARVWCLFYVVAVNAAWVLIPYFREQITELQWTYSMVSFVIGLVLWIWLLLRTWRPTLIEIIVPLFAILPTVASVAAPTLNKMGPHPLSLLFILVPAAAHLLVAPTCRFLSRP